MIFLTKEEKTVLFFFTFVLAAGSGLGYVIKKYPKLKNAVQFIEAHQPYRKININKASYDDLVNVPYIGDSTAAKILEIRAQKGLFTSLDQIKAVKGINQKKFEIFSKHLYVK
ncbi:MAG: helix-hairpin-helix domain-containing protein [Candidatus Omnitrophica bacterium]|nr:helix-hairpin-helix domain-containing protein [Candidatus Omnitrophota bacterium]